MSGDKQEPLDEGGFPSDDLHYDYIFSTGIVILLVYISSRAPLESALVPAAICAGVLYPLSAFGSTARANITFAQSLRYQRFWIRYAASAVAYVYLWQTGHQRTSLFLVAAITGFGALRRLLG